MTRDKIFATANEMLAPLVPDGRRLGTLQEQPALHCLVQSLVDHFDHEINNARAVSKLLLDQAKIQDDIIEKLQLRVAELEKLDDRVRILETLEIQRQQRITLP